MGQKLDKLSGKEQESLNNSDLSERTGQTELSVTAIQDKSRDQNNGSFDQVSEINVSGQTTGQTGKLTLTPAYTEPQSCQPIRPVGQQEHPLKRAQWVGGDMESWSVTQTAEESKTSMYPKETRLTSNKEQISESEDLAYARTTAMQEQENGKNPKLGHSKLGYDAQSRSLTNSCHPTYEEDFVVLEEDEILRPSEREKSTVFGNGMQTGNLQSAIKRRVEEDFSVSSSEHPRASRNAPQEKGIEKTSRRKSDASDGVEAHAKSFLAEREMGQHLAEVTGSRCRLKGVSYVGAAHPETTGRGRAEWKEIMNENKKQDSIHFDKEHVSAQNKNCSAKRLRKRIDGVVGETVPSVLQEKPNGEIASSRIVVGVGDHSNQRSFAGTVSNRAKESTLSMCTEEEDSQVLSEAFNSLPPKYPSSETPLLQDNISFSLEQCDLIACPPMVGNEGNDENVHIASLKRESELVCLSAVITPPAVTHWMSKTDKLVETQHSESMVNSQIAPDTTSATCDSKDLPVPQIKSKVKGPPPPVPKKPKNPFVKLKTAQILSSDVQRRGKDHLHSEEKRRRRHTFHFRDTPRNTPRNQDMCLLWDERGAYTVAPNRRPLSVDLSPWEQLLPGHMDDRHEEMIDFDYCLRMTKLRQEEELQNLDMLERSVFLERRSRFKPSPPPVPSKPPNPFASTETLHISEVIPDNDTRSTKSRSEKREFHSELQSKRVNAQVSNSNHVRNKHKDITDQGGYQDADGANEVGSYKPVAKLIKETNQMQRHHGRVKPEAAKAQIRMAEQSSSVKVSQMKNAFDVQRKSKERQPEAQSCPKKGKKLVHV